MITGEFMNIFLNTVVSECDSTNDLARKLGEGGAPSGSWVAAEMQMQGRGRQGRNWLSARGNLFLSIVLRGENLPLTWVPLLSAVAVVETITELDSSIPLRIKWPNDLVIATVDGVAKIGGILCEGVGSPGGSFVVVGIGINCHTAPSADQLTGRVDVSAEKLREALIPRLREIPTDTIAMKKRYLDYSFLKIGQALEWSSVERPADRSAGELSGIGDFGELLVQTPGGLRSLWSEEIRLDKQ